MLKAAAAGLAAASLAGCAPVTAYRYTALVPAARPLAWDGRTGQQGSLRLEGTLAKATVERNYAPVEHDTAVHVAEVMVEGAAALAVTSGFEIGVRAAYAQYAWSVPSAVGTEPLPSHPGSWGIGPEVRGTIPIGKARRFAIGLAGNAMNYDVPYAEWSRTGPDSPNGQTTPCAPSPTCTVDSSGTHYALFSERSEGHWTISFGVYPSYAFGEHGEYGRIFALLGGHTGFQNDGFTDRPTNGSTVKTTGPVWMAGAGYGIELDALHLGALLYQPLGESTIAYGPGGMLTVGLNVDLWDPKGGRRSDETD